ncbi:fimbrial biogenesis outer membrane usher protein [Pseudomonas aeruginosa]|uniref:fimbria/pilus outer membrane usher protein n=1 Tax=Pseudomonas aeruginosa TaxID=287 RepID=UPI000F835FB4|nr:fimbria/pilus outer membrane usher protein [Pseudomonas aeruginosa]MCT2415648.1 fimbrial biogenesis outer membrane usher protein [Pseudomonas aeruginosa]RTU08939.1 fimbrial biogenesis outer membrane usher protein [Pseudomonas aeruginosa]HBN9706125.1 fimbrial biogenesis outer membrane usher protein [Pseudomonas aeruginosa]HBN9768112.1 fimbrial biogenesis outer membrane usher protein [Pseudomonas aeruginosa]HBN9889789.1 fimbrial biogenesis outer membrane usher protein [Pseudomonas aeruginosa]
MYKPASGRRFHRISVACGAGVWTTLVLICAGGTMSKSDAVAAASLDKPVDDLQASFNPAFLSHGKTDQSVDLSRFETGNFLPAGVYRMDVLVNGNWVARQSIRIANPEHGSRACLQTEQLRGWGVVVDKLDAAGAVAGECLLLEKLIPEAHVEVEASELQVRLSIPQAFLERQVRGYVDPVHWDGGMAAAFLGYNVNAIQSRQQGREQTHYSAGLNAGLNVGGWRLRHNGNYSESRTQGGRTTSDYSAISSYVQRDVTGLRAQMTLGEYYTPVELFDSVPFTGVQLASDDRMLPDSQRGFAPAIRGTAETNAKVTVRQGDIVLYETTVAPGPFIIDDLYSAGYNGDLEVTVEEADGREHRFTVPYASVAQLLRPGQSRFSVSLGRYRDDSLRSVPDFVQGTYQRGISNRWTGYLGGVFADRYHATQAGIALNTTMGALAADITESRASGLPETQAGIRRDMRGRSYRLTYSKVLDSSRTNFTLAAYRFASEGYLNFSDYARIADSKPDSIGVSFRQRNRFQLNVTQPLPGDAGSFYFSGSAQNYWTPGQGSDVTFQAGYNRGFSWGSLGLSASRTRSGTNEAQNQYLLSLSLPLGRSTTSPYLSSMLAVQDHRTSLQTTLSGALDDERRLNYSLANSSQRDDDGHSSSSAANLQYRASSGDFSLGLNSGSGYRQLNASARGTLLAHSGGVTAGPPLSETMALIEAKGAEGATVVNNGVHLDKAGYALVTGLLPYRRNDVNLDPKGSSFDVELESTSQKVAPRYGSIVRLSYATRKGIPVLLKVRQPNGQPIAVGAEVFDSQGKWQSLVGQGGRIFLRVAEDQGQVWVSWGKEPNERCRVSYRLPEDRDNEKGRMTILKGLCLPPSVSDSANPTLLGQR